MENPALAIGFICGLVAVVLIARLLAKHLTTDGSIKTQYDERQLIEKGKGYRCGFNAMVIYACVLIFLDFLTEVPLPLYLLMVLGILVGCVAHILYCIFHGAYWGLNNDAKKYTLFLGFVGIVNLIIGIANLIVDGKLLDPAGIYSIVNLIIAIFIGIVLLAIFIKSAQDKREEA